MHWTEFPPAVVAAEPPRRVWRDGVHEILLSTPFVSTALIFQEDSMNKFAILLTTVLAAGFVGLKMMETPSGEFSWSDEQKLQEKLATYRCFKQTLETSVDELGKGEIRLREAHARVLEAARRFHPEFFAHLIRAEPGNSDEQRVAHNLVEHVRSVEEMDPNVRRQLPELEMELQELLMENSPAPK
jgi:hypothetical protein